MTIFHVSNPALTLRAGDRVTRKELNARFGGGIQGGMLTPAGGQYLFLFSDPEAGRTYGYDFDGWADATNETFYYTGEGSDGPQTPTRRNKILLDSRDTGREIHLFVAVGKQPGSQVRIHEYLGQFTLDNRIPFRTETGLDYRRIELRTVLVFTLNRFDPEPLPLADTHPLAEQPSSTTATRVVPREASNVVTFPRAGVVESTATRRERALENGLISWLEKQGKSAARLEIRIAGQSARLYTDTWVQEDRELFEVKGNATRNDVRMAIAQLLDYSRHITPAPSRATVVLPAHPGPDLVHLIESCELSLAIMTATELERVSRA